MLKAIGLSSFLSVAAFACLGVPDGLLGVAWPFMRTDLAVSLASIGTLLACSTVAYITASGLTGAALNRVPLRVLLSISLFVLGFALVGFALSQSWPLVLLLALATGAGGGALDGSMNAYGASVMSVSEINRLHAFFALGATVGPFLFVFLFSMGWGWRSGYFVLGTFEIILAVVYLLLFEGRSETANGSKTDHSGNGLQPGFGLPGHRQVLVSGSSSAFFFLYSGVEIAIAHWGAILLIETNSAIASVTAFRLASFWASMIIGRLMAGRLVQRVGIVLLLRASLACAMGALIFLSLGFGGIFYFFIFPLIGFSLAPVFATHIFLTPNRHSRESSRMVGLEIASAALGAVTVVYTIGILVFRLGFDIVFPALTFLVLLLIALQEVLFRFTPGLEPRRH